MATQTIIPRHALAELRFALENSRVVNIVGPRQVGKTTLVRNSLGRGRYCDLDHPPTLRALREDMEGHLLGMAAEGEAPVIIDEAQNLKELALVIKRIVDRNSAPGQFVLTGSSNIFSLPDIADSLAGRVWSIPLWPLSAAEIRRRAPSRILDWAASDAPDLARIGTPEPLTREEYIEIFLRGGFPAAHALGARARETQYRAYADAMADQDARKVLPLQKPERLRLLLQQMAMRTAAEISIAPLAQTLQLGRSTTEHYLDLLLRMFVAVRLPAWAAGETRRGIRRAKYHFTDTGMACALRGLDAASFAVDADAPLLGPIAETFALQELLRSLPHQQRRFELHHWRSMDRKEIDIIASASRAMVGIEVKATRLPDEKAFAHLDAFADSHLPRGRTFTRMVLYLGEEKLRMGPRRFLLPLSALWSPVEGMGDAA